MSQDNKPDQLNLYREEQKRKYEQQARQKIRSEYLRNKYSKLLELNPIKRSVSRIIYAVKKHILPTPINEETLNSIPGRFRLRLQITELNSFEPELQKEIFRNATHNYDNNMSQMIIQSLKDSYAPLFWIVIDLRVYGPHPEMAINLPGCDHTLFLSGDQINKVVNMWNKINPDLSNGVRFQQMLDCSKALSEIYNLLKK